MSVPADPVELSAPAELTAPAKLTVSLRVTGVRADGYHLVESEMVTLDLVDTLRVADGDGLTVDEQFAGRSGEDRGWRSGEVGAGPDNLVARALRAVGRTAQVELIKRIPPGAGLGGGSADAAAILRWARCTACCTRPIRRGSTAAAWRPPCGRRRWPAASRS